jgi:hypothetical protein
MNKKICAIEKTTVIQSRVTVSEKKRIEKEAKENGRSLSGHVRHILNQNV